MEEIIGSTIAVMVISILVGIYRFFFQVNPDNILRSIHQAKKEFDKAVLSGNKAKANESFLKANELINETIKMLHSEPAESDDDKKDIKDGEAIIESLRTEMRNTLATLR